MSDMNAWSRPFSGWIFILSILQISLNVFVKKNILFFGNMWVRKHFRCQNWTSLMTHSGCFQYNSIKFAHSLMCIICVVFFSLLQLNQHCPIIIRKKHGRNYRRLSSQFKHRNRSNIRWKNCIRLWKICVVIEWTLNCTRNWLPSPNHMSNSISKRFSLIRMINWYVPFSCQTIWIPKK